MVTMMVQTSQPHAQSGWRTHALSDAANLRKVYNGVPTLILGPGEAPMAHQTDEYCSMERIRQSVQIYEEIIQDYCKA